MNYFRINDTCQGTTLAFSQREAQRPDGCEVVPKGVLTTPALAAEQKVHAMKKF
jgi:hypothetical protein